ncbi:hypothetical protein DKT77_03865 [Meridianimarinicoccus roseus]|uniref:Uncharacterized protein n=1 Tax=Meridianimarinicoccus roseus TaxID=2072018 RepID=A0A2V2LFU6_9RHOB|nr:hypothetical protein DKT77_03865 [Meridianimarinicoccus roseus]
MNGLIDWKVTPAVGSRSKDSRWSKPEIESPLLPVGSRVTDQSKLNTDRFAGFVVSVGDSKVQVSMPS